MTSCSNFRDQLLDAALGAAASPELESHLAGCQACTTALAELRSASLQMDEGVRELVRNIEPSPAFRARVLSALMARSARRRWRPVWATAIAAGVLVAAVATFIPRPGPAVFVPAGSLSRWHSPTASLLRFPAEEYLQSPPRLGELYFAIDTTSSRPHPKANRRRTP